VGISLIQYRTAACERSVGTIDESGRAARVAIWPKLDKSNRIPSFTTIACSRRSIIPSRRGDVHVHFFGTATLSFADGIRTEHGDIFEIEAKPFRLPLRNALAVNPSQEVRIRLL
jgi:hypothetical protein